MSRRIDLSTMAGIVAALALILTAIYMGGNVHAFVDVPSVLIVFIGTFAVTVACFSFEDVWHTFKILIRIVLYRPLDASLAAIFALEIAERARKQGVLSLEQEPEIEGHSKLFYKGIMLLADANIPEHIDKILTLDISAMTERHSKAVSVLRKAAEVAPAMGLIGTLIGLVQMLGSIADASKIGPAMAVALLTTFYGAMLAYVVLFPLASKLERNSRDEMLVTRIYYRAVLSIANKENPRQLETLINSLLPPAKRVHYFKS